MKSIARHQLDNSMPCFNPENVIFITNKWDAIVNYEDDSSDEDDETITWNTLKDDIKRIWPSVKEELIFKMNLREVIINQVKLIVVYVFAYFGLDFAKYFPMVKYLFLLERFLREKRTFQQNNSRNLKEF